MEKRALAVRAEQWRNTIACAKRSGRPVKAWCAENGVALSTFYKWQRKLRDSLLEARELPQPVFAELKRPAPEYSISASGRIVLRIQDVVIELPASAPAAQISEVIRGVRHAG